MVFDTVAGGAGDIAALIIISIQHRLQTNEKRPHPAMVRAKIRIQNSKLRMARTRVGGWGGGGEEGKDKKATITCFCRLCPSKTTRIDR